MRLIKFILFAGVFFASLHFSFVVAEAAENGMNEEELVEGVETISEEDTPVDEIEFVDSIHNPEETELESDGTVPVDKDNSNHTESSNETTTKDTETETTETDINGTKESQSSIKESDNVEDTKVIEENVENDEEKIEDNAKMQSISTFSVKQAEKPYKLGDRHEDLKSIKSQLNSIGFGGISVTDYFGSWTETRVLQFQEYYGLSATGELDQTTIDKIASVYHSPFQLGKRHESTIELKEKLNALGYGHISVTNLYGDWTVNRVKKFQRENGLRVNGIADEPTWAKINDLMSEMEFKVGDRHPDIIIIKQKLNAVGFDGISETDYYGSWMKTRVTQFQEYYGLKKTGTTNKATLDKLDEVYNSPFQLNKRHHSTIELKEKLNALGYGHITVTDLYGSWTVNRVKKFQKENGLRVNGIADERTWAKIDELYSQTEFKFGDRHPNIISIKQKLNAIGFDGISETDYYGSWMRTRVNQFQEYYGLPKTGTTNKATMDKLNEVYNSPYQLGVRHNGTIELKKKLNRIGFGHITVSDLYGSFTVKQVEKFQRHYGLKVNGIADEVTQKKINEIYNHPLQKGKRSSRLIDIKRSLNALGYDGISLTDYFGSWTETRLKQFQRDHNLPVSGIADDITVQAIEDNSFVRIFIDPGHGAHDSGASAYGLREKDVVLDIALSLARELNKYKNVEVMLSRSDDTYLSLSERSKKANSWGASYFVSLHINAHNGSANGFESFIYNGSVSQETKDRQNDIHTHLASWLKSNSGINDRGKKRANFAVLRESDMPAILLEYMFIDNKRENNLLTSKSYRERLGKVTAEAIVKSFNLKKK